MNEKAICLKDNYMTTMVVILLFTSVILLLLTYVNNYLAAVCSKQPTWYIHTDLHKECC